MKHFIFSLFFAVILNFGFGVENVKAGSIDDLTAKSKFISVHYKFLKDKGAISVFASINPQCPSVYWYSKTPTSNARAKQNWAKEVRREMTSAGFNESAISKCASSGAWVFENSELRRHPKNSKYTSFIKSGVMVLHKSGDFSPQVTPVFVQTNDYTGSQTFRMYDSNFKEICKVKSIQYNAEGSCRRFGNVSGRVTEAGGRISFRWQNSNWKVAVFTGRTPKYALGKF